ncbi:hypothetical protein EDC94DRAFT_583471 [Helicostylum pulchrum]|nr:hypothetical protein EDC94DRAFT_583471 [Helicostylum pulchrum]
MRAYFFFAKKKSLCQNGFWLSLDFTPWNRATISLILLDCLKWKVKSNYALLNAKTFAITFSQKSDVCKLCAKRNIDLYYTGPRTFEDLFSKYKETYKIQYKIYASKIEKSSEITEKALCKRKSDTITLKAPVDRSKRLKFLLDKASELVAGYSCTPKTIDNLIPNNFEIFKIYVTSADVFLRNHLSIDDRAYFQNTDNMPLSPEAVIRENSYLGLTTYYELSVHWGSMEILLTGGFYVAGSSSDIDAAKSFLTPATFYR